MNYRLPDNIGTSYKLRRQYEILKCITLKIKKKKKRKGKKKYAAQQRVYLTKKEGNFQVFCQTNGCFHCFEFQGLTS